MLKLQIFLPILTRFITRTATSKHILLKICPQILKNMSVTSDVATSICRKMLRGATRCYEMLRVFVERCYEMLRVFVERCYEMLRDATSICRKMLRDATSICRKMEAGRPARRVTNNTPTNKCTYENTIHNMY
jgi:hypothetical protein